MELTLERKLYQLTISRLDGANIYSKTYKEKIFQLVEKGIGGFIIFGGKRDEIKNFIKQIQSLAETPLFIASDVECGVGQQIEDTTLFPCQMSVAAAIDKHKPGDITLLSSALKAVAREAVNIGINLPLIPVLDVNQNPDNPIICTRAFSDNPVEVTWFGTKYIKELEDSGLISCAKHFPGHGDTAVDSHLSLPVITKSFEELRTTDLIPFLKAVKAGVSSIMMGHLSIPAVDSKPASLSEKIITGLLRREMGFEGLILSDALNMKALKDFKGVPVQCLKAGTDILLHPLDADLMVKELLCAVECGEITEEQIDEAVNRILKKKAKIHNKTTPLSPPLLRGELKGGEVDYQSHRILSSQITERSITLVKCVTGLPVMDGNEIALILAGDNSLFKSSPLKVLSKNVSTITSLIPLPQAQGLKGRVKNVFSERILIFAIFTSVAAGRGASGIDDEERDRISELIKRAETSIVISFGCPYVLQSFGGANMLIAAYDATEQAQRSVIKCLQGEMGFKGRLPVKLSC
jgi:beta-N-acetylhexosaminidase